MVGLEPSRRREDMAQIGAEMAAAQREQAAEVSRQREELRDETERHLERMAELATLLQAWATPPPPPPPGLPDSGEVVEEPRGASREPEVVDEARGGPRLSEEGEQPGKGLFLPRAVEDPLQPEAADKGREGLRWPEEEKPHEGLLEPGVVALAAVTEERRKGLQPGEVEKPGGETAVPVPGEPA